MSFPFSKQVSKQVIPTLLSIVAVAAMVAAGFLLFNSRDQLAPAEADVDFPSFVSYDDSDFDEDEVDLDWNELAQSEDWEVLEPLDDLGANDENDEIAEIAINDEITESEVIPPDLLPIDDSIPYDATSNQRPGQSSRASQGRGNATLIVVTNFHYATVTVNGEDYPAYSDDGENRGMRLQSGQPHDVVVQYQGAEKLYRITLQPGERRMLMVELSGFRAQNAPAPQPTPPRERTPTREEPEQEEEFAEGQGRITVYSRPRGQILVGERDMRQETPGTVDVDAGRHEVQVRYEDGEISETKVVRVREGSRIKLFFRQND